MVFSGLLFYIIASDRHLCMEKSQQQQHTSRDIAQHIHHKAASRRRHAPPIVLLSLLPGVYRTIH